MERERERERERKGWRNRSEATQIQGFGSGLILTGFGSMIFSIPDPEPESRDICLKKNPSIL